MKSRLLLVALCFCCNTLYSICPSGQVEVTIQIQTDDYGYEGYWNLIPAGNNCGSGTIASGGNSAVGCNGGGQRTVSSGGYSNNAIITEGPYCLADGDTFEIVYVDDWGDGGMLFTIFIEGYPVYSNLTGSGDNPGTRLTFIATGPPAIDISCSRVKNYSYEYFGNIDLKATIINYGTDTIHSFDFYYMVDLGPAAFAPISGITVAPFDSLVVTHPTPWTVSMQGDFRIDMWAINPNGTTDLNASNDSAQRNIATGAPVPNIIDDYINNSFVLTEIAGLSDSIRMPMDLDFHPVLTRKQLWVIRRDTENSGGSTVRIDHAGEPNQQTKWQRDGNAWHFMSLPSGIAFSRNENFATSPSVYDANHGGGSPFTGPTLWSSDSTIYAMPSGGNGSHLDMLHESPFSMGICSEDENKFWVFDDNDQDIVSYDFRNDHGPGNSDHSDGIIRRYTGLGIAGDPNHEIPSHLVLKHETGMLYIVDTDNDRIITMDIQSGAYVASPTPTEGVAEYSIYSGAASSVFADSGLVTPCGIDLIEDRILVSDYATGDIIIYQNNGTSGTELGRIVTGTPGIAGIKIGPEGKIWYVNSLTNQVIRIDGLNVGVEEKPSINLSVFPVPATDKINVVFNKSINEETVITIFDVTGKVVLSKPMAPGSRNLVFDVSGLAKGVYSVSLKNTLTSVARKFVKD